MPSTGITQVATVFVPVSDQDRALAFYCDVLGFEKRSDFVYAGEERWVEVVPAGAATAITLAAPRGGRPTAVETGVALVTDDVEGDHAALRAAGVDVDEAIQREDDPPFQWGGAVLGGYPPMFRFRDPDGDSFLIVARPSP